MKAVGVKVLKAKLSEYLRLVKTGETILVTERDEVIAELHPAHRQKIGELNFEEKLAEMAERGDVTLRSRDPKTIDWKKLVTPIDMKGTSVDRIIDELREDTKHPGEGPLP